MPKNYTQADERMRVRIISNGCALDFQVDGSVTAGVTQLFAFLPFERRQRLLDALVKKNGELLLKEAERAVQPSPSTPKVER